MVIQGDEAASPGLTRPGDPHEPPRPSLQYD